jgi:general L-amino acid transport system substrate-binding protein
MTTSCNAPRARRTASAAAASISFLAIAAVCAAGSAQAGPTLDKTRRADALACGVTTGVAGFSVPDSRGQWTGIDVDVCRGIAAAVLGDAQKVRFVPLTAQQRFTALQSGEVDILARVTTWNLSRDTQLGLAFGPITVYDGQSFLVPKSLGVKSAKELNGATVCVQPGTTTELNLADYFRANNMQFKPVVIEKLDEVEAAFFAGRCDVYTSYSAGLASIRATRATNPDDYVILPERISKEPIAAAVRQGDDEWYDITRWVVLAMIEAEEKGIASQNVDEMLKSPDPDVRRLLGVTPGNGKALGGLDEKWAYNAIKQVGNYGEIFDRNLGRASPLKLDRGLNELWTRGGLIYAPPLR